MVSIGTVLRPFLGLLACVGGILGCAEAITHVTGPLVKGPLAWVGNVIVAGAFLGILVCGFLGIHCKVRFIAGVRAWLLQWLQG